jgi:3-oxoacyl-[acyl-carrier protein] reductase
MGLLDDKVAIVTGSGRGIGRATATRLADAGARVVINDLDAAVAEDTARSLSRAALACPGDVSLPATAADLVAAAIEAWGRLDIVVNNAGYNWDAPLEEITDEQFQAMLDVHVMAPFRVLRAAAPHLKRAAEAERRQGMEVFRKVVNVSSISGTMGNPNQANYNAAKAAVVGLTKGLAKEWGPWKINVNAVAPGFIDTRLTAVEDAGGSIEVGDRVVALGIPAEHRRKGSDLVPIGRLGTPDEVARVVLFLSSPCSDYVHGQVLAVTGGITLGMSS